MSTLPRNSYDDVPYHSHPFPQTHPNRLAVVATLLGLTPPPPDRCCVLEMGCAAGGNLIPLAVAMPDSKFIGVDLSARQIADGQRCIDSLGLPNVELRHASILDITADYGKFDYILCHGVYSWVPPAVQDGILDVCARHLTPTGIGYVSYNTYPGWHMRGMIRDVMCYRARRFTDPATVIGQARALLDFLAQAVPQENNPYALLLKGEVEKLRKNSDSYLYHEHLEEHNSPVYFHAFVERARLRGLQYLGEADFNVMVPANFPPHVQEVLQRLSADAIEIEQYMDFISNRTFRQTLLCLPEQTPKYQVDPSVVARLHLASPARPVSPQPEIPSNKSEKFEAAGGVHLSTNEPLVKAAMLYLSQVWPRAVPFEELRAAAHAQVASAPIYPASIIAQETAFLTQRLLHIYAQVSTRLLELHVAPPRFAAEASSHPQASPLARLQAVSAATVTNLRHETQVLDVVDRQLIPRLDGSRDREDLMADLLDLASRGVLVAEHEGKRVTDAHTLRALLQPSLDQRLLSLARRALLIA